MVFKTFGNITHYLNFRRNQQRHEMKHLLQLFKDKNPLAYRNYHFTNKKGNKY